MVNQLPDESLAFFERAAEDEFGVRGKKQCLASIGRRLYEAVVCGWLCGELARQGVTEDLGRAELAGMPETKEP